MPAPGAGQLLAAGRLAYRRRRRARIRDRGLLRSPVPPPHIADLDAILKRGDHRPPDGLILRGAFPGAGALGRRRYRRTLGRRTRCWRSADTTGARQREPDRSRPARHAAAGRRGPGSRWTCAAASGWDLAGLFRQPDRWPGDVIVMTLARVGAGQGPDLDARPRSWHAPTAAASGPPAASGVGLIC